MLAESPALLSRLIDIADGTAPKCHTTARNHAAKVLEYVCASPKAARLILERGDHERLVRMVANPASGLYRRKMIASALCNMAAVGHSINRCIIDGPIG